jgi:hypothetical protein
MMPGCLLFIPSGLERSFPGIPQKPIPAVSLEDLIHTTGREPQAMIPFQEPRNPQLAQGVDLSQIQDSFFDLLRDSKRRTLGARFAVDQPLFPLLSIGLVPFVIRLPVAEV